MTDDAATVREALAMGGLSSSFQDLELAAHEALDRLTAQAARADRYEEALREVVNEFNLWSEDANDGTYAYYRSDGLMVACTKAREALDAETPDA